MPYPAKKQVHFQTENTDTHIEDPPGDDIQAPSGTANELHVRMKG